MDLLNSLKDLMPSYEAILPFSKQKVTFFPFKVKDAKNISILLQENNKKLALNAMVELITSNSKGVNILDLCLADAEFLFLQIRSKSVDEQLNLIVNKEKIQVYIPDIKHRNSYFNETIQIGKDLHIQLETPNLKTLMKLNSFDKEELLKALITKVIVKGEIFYINKFISDEIKTLLDNLPLSIIPKLEEALKRQPELFIKLNTQEGEREVSGLLSFFTCR